MYQGYNKWWCNRGPPKQTPEILDFAQNKDRHWHNRITTTVFFLMQLAIRQSEETWKSQNYTKRVMDSARNGESNCKYLLLLCVLPELNTASSQTHHSVSNDVESSPRVSRLLFLKTMKKQRGNKRWRRRLAKSRRRPASWTWLPLAPSSPISPIAPPPPLLLSNGLLPTALHLAFRRRRTTVPITVGAPGNTKP